ncbi:MAG: succinylglutamate-semialdehyde dehydrogenase [Verrucomicrobia bacterium]|nr:MAG: succinylglutamate-semialdehyde dehydrogenase [Verrucomicrobiota bacterium]
MKTPSLPHQTAYINGSWSNVSGDSFFSINPSTNEVFWQGHSASEEDVNRAVTSAYEAFPGWANLTLSERQNHLQSFINILTEHKKDLARTISNEVGKPLWEALFEVQNVINKLPISVEAYNQRCQPISGGQALARFKPHGPVVVFGPFNSPLHIALGHIIPALLAGNTVIFKPSELAPCVAQKTIELFDRSRLPAGILNLVQGAKEVGQSLIKHPLIKGIFFTGSLSTGIAINKTVAHEIQKIVTLELGGNNPLVIYNVKNLEAAAHITIQSAFLSSGQRCTCTRRLIISNNEEGEKFLIELIRQINLLKIGPVSDRPEPFMGPIISLQAAAKLLEVQEKLISQGGVSLLPLKKLSEKIPLLSPGLIDVTSIRKSEDQELFGPILQCIRVSSLDEAIEEANRTAYGLAASIITDKKDAYDLFYKKVNAGVINWNYQTTGASSAVPFGGIGLSGNHRPTAFFAADYSSYPVASIEFPLVELPKELPSGIALH